MKHHYHLPSPYTSLKILAVKQIRSMLLPLSFNTTDEEKSEYISSNKEFLIKLDELPQDLISLISDISTFELDIYSLRTYQSVFVNLAHLSHWNKNLFNHSYLRILGDSCGRSSLNLHSIQQYKIPNLKSLGERTITYYLPKWAHLEKLVLINERYLNNYDDWKKLSYLTNLQSLHISHLNSKSNWNAGLKIITFNLTNLTSLSISNKWWSNDEISRLSNLQQLKVLRIIGNFKHVINTEFTTELQFLSLKHFNGVETQQDLIFLKSLTNLQGLCLEGMNLYEIRLETLINFIDSAPNLNYLDLSHNNITNFPLFSRLREITYLNLSINNIQYSNLIELVSCATSLKGLELAYSFIGTNSSLLIESLEKLTNLYFLNLSNNKLNDESVPFLKSLNGLISGFNESSNVIPIFLFKDNNFDYQATQTLLSHFKMPSKFRVYTKLMDPDKIMTICDNSHLFAKIHIDYYGDCKVCLEYM